MRPHPSPSSGLLAGYPPGPRGLLIFVWKGWLQSRRLLDIKAVIPWLALFGLAFGMIVTHSWATFTWIFIIWGFVIDRVCPRRFISDLGLWPLFRQLPFSSQAILLADISASVTAATLLCWMAYGIARLIGWQADLSIAILAPGVILCLTLTAVFDILRLSKGEGLLAGHPAQMGAVGFYLGLILAGLPQVLVISFAGWGNPGITGWIASVLGLILCLGIAFGMWRLAASQFSTLK